MRDGRCCLHECVARARFMWIPGRDRVRKELVRFRVVRRFRLRSLPGFFVDDTHGHTLQAITSALALVARVGLLDQTLQPDPDCADLLVSAATIAAEQLCSDSDLLDDLPEKHPFRLHCVFELVLLDLPLVPLSVMRCLERFDSVVETPPPAQPHQPSEEKQSDDPRRELNLGLHGVRLHECLRLLPLMSTPLVLLFFLPSPIPLILVVSLASLSDFLF